MNRTAAILLGVALSGSSIIRAAEPAYSFQSRLDDTAYAEAVSALPAKRADPAAAAASNFPTWGVLVLSVDSGTQGLAAGITPGSLIDRLNGSEYHYHKQHLDADASGRREVSWVTPDGVRHDFNFKAGRIGTWAGKGYLSEQHVFQNTPRGKWDADLLAACLAWVAGDHPLAESALQRAIAAGLPESVFTTYFSALLAFDHGDRELSRKLYDQVLAELPSDRKTISRFFHPGLMTLALAFQDFALLEILSADREGMHGEAQPATIRRWKEWAKNAPHESLYPRAVANAGENVMRSAIPLKGDWGGDFTTMQDPEPLRRDNFGANIALHHYYQFAFAPPVPTRDAIWDVWAAMGDGGVRDPMNSSSYSEFIVSLIDRNGTSATAMASPRQRLAQAIASFDCFRDSDGERFVRLSGGPSGEEIETQNFIPLLNNAEMKGLYSQNNGDRIRIDPADPHFFRITLIRLGDEAEILLNGQSIFHIPVDPKAGDLGCVIHSVGAPYIIGHTSLRPIYGELKF